jgi:hypothetical protein
MATFINTTKNIALFINGKVSAFFGFIVTEDNSKVLLGENEDQYLIWNRPTSYTNITKN